MIFPKDRFTCNLSHKASSADNGTKKAIIIANSNKYSVSAMCKLLGVSRSTVYYNSQDQERTKRLWVYCFKTQDITNYEETWFSI